MRVTVALMLKAPVAGRVKTRLGREIGDEAAAEVYRRLVERQMRQIPGGYAVRVCFDPPDARAQMQEWLGGGPEYVAQAAGDLGQRLETVMRGHFRSHAGPLVFIGGDCPDLGPARFAEVERMLSRAEAAIVPARDGGYCLLGLRQQTENVFRQIPWSSAQVMGETRARLREAGLTWEEAAPLEDVDDVESWRRAVARYPELGLAR